MFSANTTPVAYEASLPTCSSERATPTETAATWGWVTKTAEFWPNGAFAEEGVTYCAAQDIVLRRKMNDEPLEQPGNGVPVIRRVGLVLGWLCFVVVLGLVPLTGHVWALITRR